MVDGSSMSVRAAIEEGRTALGHRVWLDFDQGVVRLEDFGAPRRTGAVMATQQGATLADRRVPVPM